MPWFGLLKRGTKIKKIVTPSIAALPNSTSVKEKPDKLF